MQRRKKSLQWLPLFLAAFLVAGIGSVQLAQALTPEGTVIGNSATASYYDEDNNEYTTTSNIVQTVVLEVCGLTVTPTGAITYKATPGQTVYIPMTLTNTGNGQADFSFSDPDSVDFDKTIYRDGNQNGVVDPAEPAIPTGNTITLNMDETVDLIIAVAVAAGTAGTSDTFTVTATSANPAGCNAITAGITVDVVDDAVIQASKQVDKSVGAPADTLTYTVTFKNIGTQPAMSRIDAYNVDTDDNGAVDANVDGILLTDSIPDGSAFATGTASGQPQSNPDGFVVYSADGTNWYKTEANAGGAAAITHVGFFMPDDDVVAGVHTDDGVSEDVLDPDQQGTFTYQVTVDDPFQDNDGSVDNTATIEYRDSDSDETTTTNEVNTLIPASATADVAIGPDAADGEEDGVWQDDNTQAAAPAGYWVEFTHTAQNRDYNNSDVINLQVEAKPAAGWIVEFYNADGTSKLIDNDGDGNPDLGTLDPNDGAGNGPDTKDFTVKVFIPSTISGDNTGAGWDIDILATSANNPTEEDRSRDTIDDVIGASVDIADRGDAGDGNDMVSDGDTDAGTNNADVDDTRDGEEAGAEAYTVDPGDTAVYDIEVVNNGGGSDSYELTAAGNPAGTTAKFYVDNDCDGDQDTEITDTPLLGGTALSAAEAAGQTVLSVYSVANFNIGDTVVIQTDSGYDRTTIAAIDTSAVTITVDVALTDAAASGNLVSERICIVMTIETQSDTPAGASNIVVTATSSNSGASNNMDAYFEVNEVCGVLLSPDSSDQLPAGGTTTYQHTVTNTGNSQKTVLVEDVIAGLKLNYIFIADGANWMSFGADDAYLGGDDAALSDGDTAPLGTIYTVLNAGETETFRVRVSAPTSVTSGTVEPADITATVDFDEDDVFGGATDCAATVTDTTSIIEGYLQLTKTQVTADTDGPDDAGVCGDGPDTINPGPCDEITYKVEYKNIGSENAVNVIVTDAIPDNTTFVANSLGFDAECDDFVVDTAATDALDDDEGEYDSANNLVRFFVEGAAADADGATDTGGTLAPGESGCILFKVKIK